MDSANGEKLCHNCGHVKHKKTRQYGAVGYGVPFNPDPDHDGDIDPPGQPARY